MKCLSMYQPYAWMVANGHTDIDDRSWPSNHRGDLAIHASKTFEPHYYAYVKYQLGIDIPPPEELEYGGVVAIVGMIDCLPPGTVTNVPHDRRAHGGPHCYGFVFENVRKLDFVPCRGKPGIFDVDLVADRVEEKQQSLF